MKTIDITTILGAELKSRTSARDFATYLRNMKVMEACVDFSRVNSVTRSFMDEFYQLLLKNGRMQDTSIVLVGMGEQAEAFLKSVERTSTNPRPEVDNSNARFVNLQTVEQLSEYLESMR
ncbi:MAG: hypothetical protein IJV19_02635 [Prevotella sp.]|nr:hypothetical protein [Prevotella sp.]